MWPNLIPLYLYQGPALPRPERLYDYVLARQGLIKRLETAYVSVDTLLIPIEETLTGLRLGDYPLQPLQFKLPRIPETLLLELWADACQDLSLEFMYHLRFAPGQGWLVTRPELAHQSGTYLRYTTSQPAGIALEIHSHNTMPAFFSPTDDGDEQGGRFYGVIGHLDRPRPELALRLGLYGHWLAEIPPLTLFEGLGPFLWAAPEEELYPPADAQPALRRWLAALWRGL